MKVELKFYTKPAVDSFQKELKVDDWSVQDMIAYTARVSNPANQNNIETSDRLIRYLIKNKHWSPFEVVSATLEIETTRAIGRQILRHRSFTFQEFSQRYAVQDMGCEPMEARLQDTKNRQSSIQIDDTDWTATEWKSMQNYVWRVSTDIYKKAIDMGIAKEVARSVLPEMATTRMYMTGSLRSWYHYVQLRSGNGTQKEHRDVALACAEVIKPIFPMIMEAVENNTEQQGK